MSRRPGANHPWARKKRKDAEKPKPSGQLKKVVKDGQEITICPRRHAEGSVYPAYVGKSILY